MRVGSIGWQDCIRQATEAKARCRLYRILRRYERMYQHPKIFA